VQLRVPRVADAVAAGWPAAGPGETQPQQRTEDQAPDRAQTETETQVRTEDQAPDRAQTETETQEAVDRG
ncbi:hypothetical protein MTQ16_02115, partial [Corynebacterium bovis]|uniref:hypothetical protein n=1 Tax=Corynebacterium bovis TaxID=36808 RepID=UPI0031387C70